MRAASRTRRTNSASIASTMAGSVTNRESDTGVPRGAPFTCAVPGRVGTSVAAETLPPGAVGCLGRIVPPRVSPLVEPEVMAR